MIRIRWERSAGHMLIAIDGHEFEEGGDSARAHVCTAVTAIAQAAVAGLMSYAKTFPDKVECTEIAPRKDRDPQGTPTGEPIPANPANG